MSRYRLITQRIGLISVTDLIFRLSNLLLLPILTKSLSIEDYGVFIQTGVMISFLVPLAGLGLNSASYRYLSGEKDQDVISRGMMSIIITICITSIAMSSVLLIFSKEISSLIFGVPDFEYYVRLTALLVITGGFGAMMDIYFETFQLIKKRSFFILLATILKISLLSGSIMAGLGIKGAIVSLLAIDLILVFLKALVVSSRIKLSLPSKSLIWTYLIFSLPLVPALISNWIFNLSDRFIIGYFLGLSSVGIYSAAYNIGTTINLFYGIVCVVLLPTISKLYEENQLTEIQAYLNYLIKFYMMFTIPSFFGLAILSEKLILILTTPSISHYFFIVPLVALATIFFNYGSIYGNILILYKKTKLFGEICAFSAVFNIVATILLVNLIGIMGAALATLITFGIYSIMNILLSSKEVRLNVDWRFILKCILSSGLMAIIISIMDPNGVMSVMATSGIGAAVYFVALILLRGISREEISCCRAG